MSEAGLARREQADIIERVLTAGDLSRLTPEQRASYYGKVCESLGLNPYTRPFEYLSINGKLTLYARKDATDQLRRIHRISTSIVGRDQRDDLFTVTARATTPDGRADEAVGVVPVAGLAGEQLAAAMMKAETKAKRRVTLSIVGLGWTDESELPGLPRAEIVSPEQVESSTPPALEAPAPPESAPEAPTGGDAAASAEPAPVSAPVVRRDPIWRSHQALLEALKRVGVEPAALSEAASREEVQRWIDQHRDLLRTRADARRSRAA